MSRCVNGIEGISAVITRTVGIPVSPREIFRYMRRRGLHCVPAPIRIKGDKYYADEDQLVEWSQTLMLANQQFFEERAQRLRVYFIQMGEGGPIKVGVAGNVNKRRAAIQTHCPYHCTVLASFKGGFKEETEVHRVFADLRLNGEWFECQPELLAFIEQIKERTNEEPASKERRRA